MTLSSLVKSTIINGANTLAVAVREGIVYRLQPVETVTEVTLNNFKTEELKSFDLSTLLKQDYKVVGFSTDLALDDDEHFDSPRNKPRSDSYNLYLRTFKGNKARDNYFVDRDSYAKEFVPFYLHFDDTLEVRISRDTNSITLYCVPIIFNESINFS